MRELNRFHLFIEGHTRHGAYTSHADWDPTRPQRRMRREEPIEHGRSLLERLDEAWQASQEQLNFRRSVVGIQGKQKVFLEFVSDPDFESALKQLDRARSGIEVVSVRERDGLEMATVAVPENKRAIFQRLIGKYVETAEQGERPKNKFVNSIEDIRWAVFESFWTDDPDLLPAPDEAIWWEVWLRIDPVPMTDVEAEDDAIEAQGERVDPVFRQFVDLVVSHQMTPTPVQPLVFVDRLVTMVFGTTEQMHWAVYGLDTVAELRKAKETPAEFLELPVDGQWEFLNDMRGRITPPGPAAPVVCVLDTGMTQGHPLIAPALDPADLHTIDARWGVDDRVGHGTEMAGIVLYGDLIAAMMSRHPVHLQHRLESVKLLPPRGFAPNQAHLYGSLTKQAVHLAEIQEPGRERVVCLPVTTTDFRDLGQPSSWSGAMDQLCVGTDGDLPRLVVISAGNLDQVVGRLYPDNNESEGIHDPGQAWNALTVGAYTTKFQINDAGHAAWAPVAPAGDLSPSSTTSLIWEDAWPIKPDIVMEGGNYGMEPATGTTLALYSLRMLTTGHQPLRYPFAEFGDTSAAAALAARLGATLQAHYPEFWPETIRALMVHAADWTPAMVQRGEESGLEGQDLMRYMLALYGWGVPNEQVALGSGANYLTMIIEDEFQPFTREGGRTKSNQMAYHTLPWPVEELERLGDLEVELRVTLSYFIEPNPARRGWKYRHRYASHGLRFEVKSPLETDADFATRVNQAAVAEYGRDRATVSDWNQWRLGPNLQTRGSIHSDTWTGTGAQLARKNGIGVRPVKGWWYERHQLGRWNSRARYALVVSLKVPPVGVDIYTPVYNQITVQTEIE